jgi:hypothetical protein
MSHLNVRNDVILIATRCEQESSSETMNDKEICVRATECLINCMEIVLLIQQVPDRHIKSKINP